MTRAFQESRAALVVALVISQAGTIRWYVQRLGDGGDDAICLLPLALLLAFVPRETWLLPRSRRDGREAWVSLLLLAASSWFLRPLLTTTLLLLWITRFTATAGWPGRCLLALAAVPSGPSLQFYLGYPLRRATTELAAAVLHLAGAQVSASGTVLRGNSGDVAVDAPCSGLHALWVALVLVGAVSAFARCSAGQTVRLGLWALGAVVFTNALRASLLYPFLTGAWPEFPGYHAGVGLLCFALWFIPWSNRVLGSRRAESIL